jgi:hypothetical protein
MAIRGKCHCGATAFTVAAAPKSVTRCTCTFCAKRGGLWAYYAPEQFELLSGRDQGSYSSDPQDHKHFFCKVCGCGTYSDTPTYQDFKLVPGVRHVPVNARLFEDFDLDSVPVEVIDGKNLW